MKHLFFVILILVAINQTTAQVIDIEKLPKAKKFSWSGSVGANTTVYNASGIENRSNPFSWNIHGNFNANILETLDLPFAFTINKFQSSFSKPQLQFGISPKYKSFMLHLGHRNLSFNPYTLSGHTFLGAGVEFNPKKWRIAGMYGRLRQAIEFDTATNTLRVPSFKRKGYGAKLGYGTPDNFIDLIYFHAKDDSNSIHSWKDQKILEQMGDGSALTPAENDVMGISSILTIAKNLSLQVDAGLSLFNKNISDTINKKTVSASANLNWAGKASLGYNFGNFQLRGEYEKILPGYITMGSYFFNDDMENITIAPSGAFVNGKLNFSGAIGLQKNNIDEDKEQTTKRFIGTGNISINPSTAWGVDMSYNNLGVRTLPVNQPVNDSFQIRHVNQTFVVSPRYTIAKDTSATHSFSINLSMNDVNDRNIITKQYGNMKASMINLNHVSNIIRNGSSISTGVNYNNTEMSAGRNTQIGFTLGYSRSLLNNALNFSISDNFNLSSIDNKRDGTVMNATATVGYSLKDHHNLNFNFNLIKTTSIQFQNFTETIATVGYVLRLK